MSVVEEFRHHDVAPLDQPDPGRRPGAACERAGPADPWTARVDDAPRRDGDALARYPVGKDRGPARAARRERDAGGAGADLRTPGAGIAGVQYHQPRILHPAVRVLEGPAIAAPQRAPARVPAEVDARARRQLVAPAEAVVEKEAQPDRPPGAHPGVMREHEAHRPDDVRGVAQEHNALAQGAAHEAEVAVLHVAKPAMDQLGAGRRGVRGQIVLLAQQHVEAAPRRVPGDAGAVDTAADDEQIDRARRRPPHTHLRLAHR